MSLPPLYLISDRTCVPGGDMLVALDAALSAGVRLLQLREKDLAARPLLALAEAVQALCLRHGARLLINDRADIALAVGCGVHLTSAQPPIVAVRTLLGPEALIGVSTHHPQEVHDATQQGADLVTYGPLFDTPSKRGMGEPVGLAALAQLMAETSVPVYALGGINTARISSVRAAGCQRVALISEVLAAADPAARVKALNAALT